MNDYTADDCIDIYKEVLSGQRKDTSKCSGVQEIPSTMRMQRLSRCKDTFIENRLGDVGGVFSISAMVALENAYPGRFSPEEKKSTNKQEFLEEGTAVEDASGAQLGFFRCGLIDSP